MRMNRLVEGFKADLAGAGRPENTVLAYGRAAEGYAKWYFDSFGEEMEKLFAGNVSDYIAYLRTVKELRGTSLNPKVSGLKAFNKYLIREGVQPEMVVNENHRDKVQAMGVSPSLVDQAEVDAFRQKVLVEDGVRDHAIVTVLAYAGLRISELVNLKLSCVDIIGMELTIYGKGNKVRVVDMSPKVRHAIREYLKVRNSDSPYLFVSRQSPKAHRSIGNRICGRHSGVITPHTLRHFFCTHALDVGYSVSEVAYMAGHGSVRTTTGYLNASRKEMKEKAARL
jgi:integrase/recombinase XerD